MSFPSRHPMMRGMMMPPFGAYPPMGMMPMGMMPMPNMMPHMMRNPIIQKEAIINPAAFAHVEKLPVTTVFVGNIHERAPDTMIKTMLQKCGNVTSWKRVQGTTGKLQAFGFCEFDDPESTLRCVRLLNELLIVNKKLLVKVDAKTNTLLEEYKKKKKDFGPNKSSTGRQTEEDKDAAVVMSFNSTMKEYEGELNRILFETSIVSSSTTSTTSTSSSGGGRGGKSHLAVVEETDKKVQAMKAKQQQSMSDPKYQVDSSQMDDEIQSLVTKEIRSFRDAHLNSERDDSRERTSSRSDRKRSRRDDDRERERDRDRDRERERDRDRDRDRIREKDRERDRERDRDRDRDRDRERDREREREVERERERERPERKHSRSKTKDASPRDETKRLNEDEDDEELYERKKLERKLREKEAAYQELLRKWESRERKRMREHDKEKLKEKEKRNEENKESKRLREFLEDYNDDRDDVKYYKGSALQQRLFERQKEMDSDDRDRVREGEEVAEIRRKLQEEGRDDVEEEMARIEQEREQHLLPRIPIVAPVQQMASPEGSYSPAVIVLDTEKTYSPSDNHEPDHPVVRSEIEEEEVVLMSNGDNNKNDAFNELDKYQDAPLENNDAGHNEYAGHADYEIPEALNRINNYNSEESDNEYPLSNNPSNHHSPIPQSFSESTEEQARVIKRKIAVHEAFNDDEEEQAQQHKKQRLLQLNYDHDNNNNNNNNKDNNINNNNSTNSNNNNNNSSSVGGSSLSAEEKRKWIKNFIERIPVQKESLFTWKVDWSLVDNDLIEKRIKPWVNKKIVEYIGEDEPALTDFICKKVLSHTPPNTILSDISMVLDDEAEVFVMKMWRLLVYEIEAKKCGVIK